MTLQPLTQTDSFTILFDDALPSAMRRATAVAASCERDTATMCGWFGVDNPFHPGNRAVIQIKDNPGNGENFGYANAFYGTLIEIRSFEGAPNQDVADQFAQSVFVAEFAEVLMGVRNGIVGHSTWNAGDSAGEALSTICQEMLYADACLRMGQGYPRAHDWLATSDWPDFMTHVDGTDRNFVSFGCGILCISYLIGQLGFSLDRIVQAEGVTLEEKFATLTGRSGAYAEITGVLSQFFGRPAAEGALRSDFPFPLLPTAERSVALAATPSRTATAPAGSGTTQLPLPFPCQGTVETAYAVTDSSWHVRYAATPHGFANPIYTWHLRAADGTATTVDPAGGDYTVLWSGQPIDPSNPTATPASAVPVNVRVLCDGPTTAPFGDAQYFLGVLDIDIDGGIGGIIATVQCEVSDQTSPGDSSATSLASIAAREVRYDDNFRTQAESCRGRAAKLLDQIKPDLLRQIMPDPAPDLIAATAVIRGLAERIAQARAEGDKTTDALLSDYALNQLGLPDTMIAAIPTPQPPLPKPPQ